MSEAKTKAKGRTRGRAPTNEGAVSAPDVSPPRLQPERPPVAFVRGETLAVHSSFSSTERTQ